MYALWLVCCLMTAPHVPVSANTPYNHPVPFILSLACDQQGDVWIGTENDGVWRCGPTGIWTQFTTADGLSENSGTAILCDSADRIWVGHRQTGISVYNGLSWKNYTTLDGPIGGRIFAIASNPTNGDVWMATDKGLARWSASPDTWTYYSRANGLRYDQATCLAFTTSGDLFVGTQANGIEIGSPIDDYKTWRHIAGPATTPNAPQGSGLPSPLINALLVSRSGTVYAGTDAGLAWTNDNGATWQFLRGADWLAKARQQSIPAPGNLPAPREELMTEDYVTSLAEYIPGVIWIGHRHTGTELYDMHSGLDAPLPNIPLYDYVRAVMTATGSRPWIGGYGGGIFAPGPAPIIAAAPENPPSFPSLAAPPSVAELTRLAYQAERVQAPLAPGQGEFLGDDWNTQGDWLGRYGEEYARLFGMQSPMDQFEGSTPGCDAQASIGAHHTGYDGVYTYISTLSTNDPRVLYDPSVSTRRDAEVNDGSWQSNIYPITFQGPNLWLTVTAPSGLQRVSLYFDNDDGHRVNSDGVGDNRLRDYTVELLPATAQRGQPATQTAMAKTRVFDFYEGVYKQFIVQGPGTFKFKIGRNHSFVTKLQGVFIDPLPNAPSFAAPGTAATKLAAAENLWRALNQADSAQGGAALDSLDRTLAYRAAVASGASQNLLQPWSAALNQWTPAERTAFDQAHGLAAPPQR